MLFTGRLTANAEVKAVKGKKQVINFTVALNERWKNKAGDKIEKTAFVECAYWRNPAIGEYLTKGTVVEISGWVDAEVYQHAKDGLKARLVCTCRTIKLFSALPKSEFQEEQKVSAGANGDLPL